MVPALCSTLQPVKYVICYCYINSFLVYLKTKSCMVTRPIKTTNPLIARPLSEKFRLCMVMSCACYGLRHSPHFNYIYREPDIAAVGTIFNIFSYDAASGRYSNLSSIPDNERMRYSRRLCPLGS